MSHLITRLFDTRATAEHAITQLKQHGYTSDEISVIMKEASEARELSEATDTHAQETSTAAIGGGVGALLGGLLAISAVAIPGIGLIAAGALAALFVGGGGVTGSAVGWMVGAGIPEDMAPHYERGLHEGGIVLAVAAHPGDEANVQGILDANTTAHSDAGDASYLSTNSAARHADTDLPIAGIRE